MTLPLFRLRSALAGGMLAAGLLAPQAASAQTTPRPGLLARLVAPRVQDEPRVDRVAEAEARQAAERAAVQRYRQGFDRLRGGRTGVAATDAPDRVLTYGTDHLPAFVPGSDAVPTLYRVVPCARERHFPLAYPLLSVRHEGRKCGWTAPCCPDCARSRHPAAAVAAWKRACIAPGLAPCPPCRLDALTVVPAAPLRPLRMQDAPRNRPAPTEPTAPTEEAPMPLADKPPATDASKPATTPLPVPVPLPDLAAPPTRTVPEVPAASEATGLRDEAAIRSVRPWTPPAAAPPAVPAIPRARATGTDRTEDVLHLPTATPTARKVRRLR